MAARIAGLYDMEDTLGSGHFAVVKSARHVFTGLRVAIKVIDKLKLDDVSKAHLYQEVRCMKMVSHPSIIRLYEVIDTQTKLYLIEELGDGGDLYDFIMKHPSGVDENLAHRIFRQAVSAIQYCHQLHVVHRDLKPENLVFCTSNGELQVKLTDFGLSRTFMPGEMIESSCGSLEYSAPEILLGDSYDPPKVDVWSLGVILFMLISGRSPFASGSANEILTHILDGRYDIPSQVTDSCKSLVSKMLVVDASKRISLNEVVHHPWLLGKEEQKVVSLPPLTLADLQYQQIRTIIHRMEQGGYGDQELILSAVQEYPYGSVAATFYLLAEAERHRKLYGGMHPSAHSKQHGAAKTGILQPRRQAMRQEESRRDGPDLMFPSSPDHSALSPYQNPQYASPRLGVGGEQVSAARTPSFPIQSVGEDSSQPDFEPPLIHVPRQLSACEEENETEEVAAVLLSPRSRKLNTTSTPSLNKVISKSDGSDEDEEEDDIVELCSTSTYIARGSLASRLSPTASPRLPSRRSPSLSWAYSSDEEPVTKEKKRIKRHVKRIHQYQKLKQLGKMDSVSSDDSNPSETRLRHSLPSFGKLLWKQPHRHNSSVPSTPAEHSGSESFAEFLAHTRPRSNSARTEGSYFDSHLESSDLVAALNARCQLSDGDEAGVVSSNEGTGLSGDGPVEMDVTGLNTAQRTHTMKHDINRKESVVCNIL